MQPTLVQLLPPGLSLLRSPFKLLAHWATHKWTIAVLDEDFASFTFGDIRASAAQIITRRIIAEPNPAATSPLSSPAVSQEQLLQIRVQYEAAELLAKTAEAEARAALARKTAQRLDLETRDQARWSASSSPRHYSPTASPPRMFSPPATRHPTPTPSQQATMDLGAVLLHLEAQRRADALQREEERRIEQRHREEDRRADRQAAEERAAQADTRHQAQLAAFVAASNPARSAVGSYVVGRALASAIPVFNGDGTADCGTYLRTSERLFKANGIPASHWPNELFIKLEDLAKGWYVHTFPDPDTFPPWSQVTSGLLNRFGPRYTAADTWASKCSATRQEGESGPAALQRLDELQQTLLLLGVPVTIGPVEQQCYQLQRLLTADEKRVWSAAANALPDVSDDAIRARETAAAAATLTSTGRQSLSSPVSVDERDLWFEPRLAHLLTFLKDQPGHPPAGGRRQPARAAAISTDAETAPLQPAPVPGPAPPGPFAPIQDGSVAEARCIAARADREKTKQRGGGLRPPPEYAGSNPSKATANQAEYDKRKACGACYHCPMNGPAKVNYAVFHTLCPTHGRDSTSEDRRDPTKRVNGSGQIFY